MNRNGFLISAPQSGSGKTTVSLAIMAALARRGLKVAPFKCGPDFIDPGYHRLATGRDSINLDGWMCGEEFVKKTFQTGLTSRTGQTSQTIAVIEGAMGLFDGLGSSTMQGSSAQVAAITGAPVVLVVNARGMAASAAALVQGFAGFDPQVRVAGVIFNRVGSESHAALLRQAIADHCPGLACFGCIPRDETLVIPSRHLGLVTAEDNPLPLEFIDRMADMAERNFDLDGLAALRLAAPHTATPRKTKQNRDVGSAVPTVKIAVARDAAFCFCYPDNLRLLREAGAEITFFSPLTDAALPDGTAGIYLPGGYPELYAEQLAANSSLAAAIRTAVTQGLPVYAECGGLVYLTEGMENGPDFVGIFPVRARMLARRKALGYRQVETTADSLLGPAGTAARGHEFHYSDIPGMPDTIGHVYQVSRNGSSLGREGYRSTNCLASYIHLHFGSCPGLADSFVKACLA